MPVSAPTLQSELWTRLQEDPDGKALTFVNSRGRIDWRNFAELHASAAACGSVLADRGLSRGDVCVLVLPSDIDCCHALLGCLLIGAVPLLVAPPVIRGLHSELAAVVQHVVRKTSARMLIVGEDSEALGRTLAASNRRLAVVSSPGQLGGGDATAISMPNVKAGEIGALQLTSGTTGFPKVCVWKQERILASLTGMQEAMRIGAEDTFLNWTPLYHDMGLVNNFLLCMVKRVPLAMIETFDFLRRPALWLKALPITEATTTWAPNFGYALATQRIRDQELDGVRLDGVRGFWNAAERIHLRTMLDFYERFSRFGLRKSAMKTNFGCAENVGGATFSDPDGEFVVERVDRRALYERGVAKPVANAGEETDGVDIVSVGRPFPGMRLRILNRTGRSLPDGHVGNVALDTPSQMVGYLRDSRETRKAIRDGWLRTGDIGYRRGDELFWVGRGKERINLHGKKYDPSDFERALLGVADLRKGCFAAFGVDDSSLGTQRLVIVSETAKTPARTDEEIVKDIEGEITGQLGITADEILLLPHGTMTKTSSGKRRHRFYRQQYVSGNLQGLPGARSFKS